MLIQENLSVEDKLRILSDAAKYDVACTSSGVKRDGKKGSLGNTTEAGICHSFAADGRCISLLKILFTNQCIYDCKYCLNRRSNDTLRTSFTPEEVCHLTMQFYRRNYIEGLFLSSGILHTPDYTMEQMYRTLKLLRTEHHFNGYIHVKAIPGADPELIEQTGFLADRMSVNLELPTAEGLRNLAPGKTRDKILVPMRQIQRGIVNQMGREGLLEKKGIVLPPGLDSESVQGSIPPEVGAVQRTEYHKETGASGHHLSVAASRGDTPSSIIPSGTSLVHPTSQPMSPSTSQPSSQPPARTVKPPRPRVIPGKSIYGNYGVNHVSNKRSYFVPAGQSTQMIVGATPESDFQMMAVAEALYKNFGLKRVFYSAYVSVNQDSMLPSLPGGPPLLREHRLYQADWLLRYYGFQAEELLTEDRPNFNVLLDPKCDWALRHLESFPVEANRADYETLLRVPGVGTKSAMRIVAARRQAILRFEDLKKLGVVLKRAMYFLTCSGKMMYPVKMTEDSIASHIVGEEKRRTWDLDSRNLFRQMSLFDDFYLDATPPAEEAVSVLTGEM